MKKWIIFFVFMFSLLTVSAYPDRFCWILNAGTVCINTTNITGLDPSFVEAYVSAFIDNDTIIREWNFSNWVNESGLMLNWSNIISGTDNSSWNETRANTLYVNKSGDTMTGSLYPSPTMSLDLGSGANRWRWLYVANISSEYIDVYGIEATQNISADYFIGNGAYLTDLNLSGDLIGYALNVSFLNGLVGGMDMRADPWYLGGTNLEVADNITTTYIIANGSRLTNVCLSNGTNCINQDNQTFATHTNLNNNITSLSNVTIARTGNCSPGQVVQNTTNGGVQCIDVVPVSTTYYPNTTTTTAGTNTTSNLTLLWYYDGDTYNVTEASGSSPVLTLNINYTNVTSFDEWVVKEYYDGSSSHNINFEIYNYDSSSWDSYYSIVGQSGYSIITMPIFDSSEHIQSGIVQTRLYHTGNGVSSHHLYVDFAWLLTGNNVVASTNLIGYAKYSFMYNNFTGFGYFNTSSHINASTFNGAWNGSVNYPTYTVLATYANLTTVYGALGQYVNYTTLSTYANKTELSTYANLTTMYGALAQYVNMTNLARYVNFTILGTYANKTELSTYTNLTTMYGALSTYANQTILAGNITIAANNISSIGNWTNNRTNYVNFTLLATYANKTELSTYANMTLLSTYANQTFVNTNINNNISVAAQNISSIGNWTNNRTNYVNFTLLATYANKTELSTYANLTTMYGALAQYANFTVLASYANKTDLSTYANKTYVDINITSIGNFTLARSQIAFKNESNNFTVNQTISANLTMGATKSKICFNTNCSVYQCFNGSSMLIVNGASVTC